MGVWLLGFFGGKHPSLRMPPTGGGLEGKANTQEGNLNFRVLWFFFFWFTSTADQQELPPKKDTPLFGFEGQGHASGLGHLRNLLVSPQFSRPLVPILVWWVAG